ncbi:MAG: histidine kinase dimerization/phosphoacceptor domain -containing protein [Spirochaetia bacterium]
MKFVEKVEKHHPGLYCTEGFPALLFENMNEGVAINRILYDSKDYPSDFEIIDVNPAYEKILGISREKAVGSRGFNLYGYEGNSYLAAYARTARTGLPERFEAEYPVLGKRLDSTIFSSKEGYFGVVFSDAGERKKTEERLELELEEKKVLLKEMHHRVKNNLTVVSSLLRLQADQVESAEDARQALEESRNRVFSMALVHEHLYQTSRFSRVGMRSYIGDVVRELENHCCGDKRVSFKLFAEDIHLDITLAVPVGIILNELLTNCLKHAFCSGEEGRIIITFERSGSFSCKLSVRDNGNGFPEEGSPEKQNCLGLNLIRILTKQIRGNLSLSNGDGAEIEINFPLVPE